MSDLTHEKIMHETEGWTRVLTALPDTKLIAFDGCHKIYLALDEEEREWFTKEGTAYETYTARTLDEYVVKLQQWYRMSCDLRFIQGVRDGDFYQLIGQW